jgi:hypothetical protein
MLTCNKNLFYLSSAYKSLSVSASGYRMPSMLCVAGEVQSYISVILALRRSVGGRGGGAQAQKGFLAYTNTSPGCLYILTRNVYGVLSGTDYALSSRF